jgi:hypothetical protein
MRLLELRLVVLQQILPMRRVDGENRATVGGAGGEGEKQNYRIQEAGFRVQELLQSRDPSAEAVTEP